MDAPLSALVGVACRSAPDMHTSDHVDDAGQFKLCLHSDDVEGLQLLLAGQMADPMYWLDPARKTSRWDGSNTNDLLVLG